MSLPNVFSQTSLLVVAMVVVAMVVVAMVVVAMVVVATVDVGCTRGHWPHAARQLAYMYLGLSPHSPLVFHTPHAVSL